MPELQSDADLEVVLAESRDGLGSGVTVVVIFPNKVGPADIESLVQLALELPSDVGLYWWERHTGANAPVATVYRAGWVVDTIVGAAAGSVLRVVRQYAVIGP